MDYHDKAWLEEEYIVKQRTAKEIADDFGLAGCTIRYHLLKHEIPLRSAKETVHLPQVIAKNSKANAGKNNAMYGKHRPESLKARLRECRIGTTLPDETKKKISNSLIGNKYRLGKHHTPKMRKQLSLSHLGEKNSRWMGGISFEPYCPKFNNDLRRRIRAFFGYRCALCGEHESDLTRRLSCHHVEYNKDACCDGKPVRFAALCLRCHSRTNTDRARWEEMMHRVIEEIYDGRSYFTKEEITEDCP